MKTWIILFVVIVAATLSVVMIKPELKDRTLRSATKDMTKTMFGGEETMVRSGIKAFSSASIAEFAKEFQFSAEIPEDWNVEYIAKSQALNFYDPKLAGETSLLQSLIFVKFFIADSFLTLSTVDILEREHQLINGHQATRYLIQNHSRAVDFFAQPPWRNAKHTVVDIRSSDAPRARFYVFAKAPNLSDEIFSAFIQSIRFQNGETTKLAEPVSEFTKRVIKKPFGIYITPQSSPVQPERFTGYHTGVDAEILPDEIQHNFFVKAVADGEVVTVKRATGYGGLVVIQHSIAGKTLYGIYGHLRLSSILLKLNDQVKAGDVIGVLGDDQSEETGGERKHLHFGLYQGEVPDIRGYVPTEAELKNWVNPLQFF